MQTPLTKSRVACSGDDERRELLKFQRLDVLVALGAAGLINRAMLFVAAALFSRTGFSPANAITSALLLAAGVLLVFDVHAGLDVLVDRYGLREAYVFSTDYPHVEGGRSPVQAFEAMAARVGAGYAEEFFVTNGSLLLPD